MLRYSWNIYLDYDISSSGSTQRDSNSYATKLKDHKLAWLASQRLYFHIDHCIPSDFWSWFQNHALPTNLPEGIRGIRFFRHLKSIAQEDYPLGGKISLSMRYQVNDEAFINQFHRLWLDLLLKIIINEDRSILDEVLGVVVRVKKEESAASIRLELWLESISNSDQLESFIARYEEWIDAYDLIKSVRSAASYRSFAEVSVA